MVLVHLQPLVVVIVCHAIATDGGLGVFDHGLCLGWILHGSVSVLAAWLVVCWKPLFGSIRLMVCLVFST